MVTIKETTYKNYGKCLSLTNDSMEMIVTIGLGPRIIKVNLLGKENLMFNDDERVKFEDVSSLYGEGKKWYIYGGHRLWVSPEAHPVTYYPDNDSVRYSTFKNGASFIPPVQDVTGFQYTITIELDDKLPKAKITHEIENTSSNTQKGAAWCLTVCDANGTVIIPQPTEQTGLLANRVYAIWPYTDMTDSRLFLGEKYIALHQDPSIEKSIKIGLNNTSGKIAYVNKNQALVKTYYPDHANGEYPDYGCSTETYACGLFIEAESLSDLKTLNPGDKLTHVETFELFDNIDAPKLTNKDLEQVAEKIF